VITHKLILINFVYRVGVEAAPAPEFYIDSEVKNTYDYLRKPVISKDRRFWSCT